MPDRTCSTCSAFDSLYIPQQGEGEQASPARTVTICRAKSATASLVPTPQGVQAMTIWPQVDAARDFCREWSPSTATSDIAAIEA
jgi:hypothetical protein